MGYETILLDREGQVGILTLNRPEKLNAMNATMLHEITTALRDLDADPEIRVCIIRGAGDRAFSAGADLSEMVDDDAFTAREKNRVWIEMFHTVESIRIPVIASVHGFAAAGGTELTLCCDLVVASEDAQFALAEIRVGLVPGAGACVRLPRGGGRAKAKEMLMTGDFVPAAEACQIGLVNRVVPRAELAAATMALAQKLASRSPLAITAAKRAVNIGSELDLDRGIEYVLQEFALLFAGEDAKEGMAAFLEKRSPNFRGRSGGRAQ